MRSKRQLTDEHSAARSAVAGLVMCSVILSFGCAAPSSEVAAYLESGRRLNVLVVSFDALRADHLGLYGYPRRTSPNIDAFAQQALVFDDAWTVAPATPTSFAAAFTGQLPPRVFRGWELVETRTIAGAFAEAGYATGFFSANVQLVAGRQFDTGFEHYEIVVGDKVPGTEIFRIGDDATVLASTIAWLREHAERPIFAWVHFLTPHSPYRPRAGAEHLFDAYYEGPFEEHTGGRFAVTSDAELARVRDLYDAGIFYGDQLFQRLMDTMEADGFLEQTIVVVTSDHGEELNDHGALQHEQLFREVVRIPLIVRHPDRQAGLRTALPVSNVDFAPTLADMTSLAWRRSTDGASWLGRVDKDRLRIAIGMTSEHARIAAQQSSFKAFVDCSGGDTLLFDLAKDPGERDNLMSAMPGRHEAIMAAVTGTLGTAPCAAASDAVTGDPAGIIDDPATVARLRALGYLGGSTPAEESDRGARLGAEPNPVVVCDGLGVGKTSIWFSGPVGEGLEIRVGEPDGPLMALVSNSGRVETGLWVRNPTEFYLVHEETRRTLAQITVRLTSEGCR